MIPAAIMILSDFRDRQVAVWSLFLLFVLCLSISIRLYGGNVVMNHIIVNILLLAYLGPVYRSICGSATAGLQIP